MTSSRVSIGEQKATLARVHHSMLANETISVELLASVQIGTIV